MGFNERMAEYHAARVRAAEQRYDQDVANAKSVATQHPSVEDLSSKVMQTLQRNLRGDVFQKIEPALKQAIQQAIKSQHAAMQAEHQRISEEVLQLIKPDEPPARFSDYSHAAQEWAKQQLLAWTQDSERDGNIRYQVNVVDRTSLLKASALNDLLNAYSRNSDGIYASVSPEKVVDGGWTYSRVPRTFDMNAYISDVGQGSSRSQTQTGA